MQQWRKGSHVSNKQPAGGGTPHACTQRSFAAFRWRCLTWGQFHWLSYRHQWLLPQVRCCLYKHIILYFTKDESRLTHPYLVIVLCRYDIPTPYNHYYSPQTPVYSKAQPRGGWNAPLALHDDLTPSICSSVHSVDQIKWKPFTNNVQFVVCYKVFLYRFKLLTPMSVCTELKFIYFQFNYSKKF